MFRKKIETVGSISDFMSGEYKNPKGKIKAQIKPVERVKPIVKATQKKVDIKSAAKKGVIGTAGAMMVLNNPLLRPTPAFAEVTNAVPTIGGQSAMVIGDEVLKAFDPLIDFIISLSYPIAGIMLSAAALMIMINQKEKGYQMLMNASIGYVAVQMMPLFLKILVHVGKTAVASFIVLI